MPSGLCKSVGRCQMWAWCPRWPWLAAAALSGPRDLYPLPPTGDEPCQHLDGIVSKPCTEPYRWWALPEVGVVPTLPLLAGFQQLVELDESKRILHELAQHRPVIDANSFSELKVGLLCANPRRTG